MPQSQLTAVIGLGEIGKPLAEMLAKLHVVHGVDLAPVTIERPVDVMHVCIPFQLPDFVGVVARYAEMYRPGLIIVNSTVVPGTSRAIAARVPALVAYSPVRGKHVKMNADMALYRKFVAGVTPPATERAAAHFEAVGIATDRMATADTLELAKLTETSYFGVLIAWAHQVMSPPPPRDWPA